MTIYYPEITSFFHFFVRSDQKIIGFTKKQVEQY